MDMETLGYFLYMEQCEREEAELLKVNVELDDDLVAEKPTTNPN